MIPGHVQSQNLKDKVILFWNTYNAQNMSENIRSIDYHELPNDFYTYFENEVQPLDNRYDT